jgi:hypothetical protein
MLLARDDKIDEVKICLVISGKTQLFDNLKHGKYRKIIYVRAIDSQSS